MDIGTTIRSIRQRKKMTIAQICEETGLSQGFMSQLENNKTSPSLATLENIATVLNVPLPYLLLKQEERIKIVRQQERTQTTSGSDKLRVDHLATTSNMRMVIVELPVGASTGESPHAHEGEEIHLILKGSIRIEQGEDCHELHMGDSFSWNACAAHTVRNIGDELAIVLISIYQHRL